MRNSSRPSAEKHKKSHPLDGLILSAYVEKRKSPQSIRDFGLHSLVLSREWGNALWDHYWRLYRDYYRHLFLHSLVSTRESNAPDTYGTYLIRQSRAAMNRILRNQAQALKPLNLGLNPKSEASKLP